MVLYNKSTHKGLTCSLNVNLSPSPPPHPAPMGSQARQSFSPTVPLEGGTKRRLIFQTSLASCYLLLPAIRYQLMRCTTNLNEKVCSLESELLVFQAVEPTELVLLMVSTHSCKKVDVDQLLGSNR